MEKMISEILDKNYIDYEIYNEDNNSIIIDFTDNEYYLPRIKIFNDYDYMEFEDIGVKINYTEYTDNELKQIMEAFCQGADEFDEVISQLEH